MVHWDNEDGSTEGRGTSIGAYIGWVWRVEGALCPKERHPASKVGAQDGGFRMDMLHRPSVTLSPLGQGSGHVLLAHAPPVLRPA